uniref:Uncharacterized protein n=1 Tax=Globodera rostochiensis TaxID=31243 RepID=A0A914I5Z6_GLORO
MASGRYWTHRGQFNVTCLNGRIKVLNCVTEQGVQLALGTKQFLEDGVRYSCQLNMDREQREKVQQQRNATADHFVPECDQQLNNGGHANTRGEFVRDGFVVDCASNNILGCMDVNGDLVKSGHFYVLSSWRLRKCEVYGRGRWAKSERKGCFNGTHWDDPDDGTLHVPVGRIWPTGPFELRCGDDGLHVYKCIVDGRRIHTGTAWIDGDNVLNVCK